MKYHWIQLFSLQKIRHSLHLATKNNNNLHFASKADEKIQMRISLYLVLIIVLCSALVCKCAEPACSKFDYEEKLLAKTIRLEVTVEDLVKTVTQVQTGLAKCESRRNEMELEIEALKNEFENQAAAIIELETKFGESPSKLNETDPDNNTGRTF